MSIQLPKLIVDSIEPDETDELVKRVLLDPKAKAKLESIFRAGSHKSGFSVCSGNVHIEVRDHGKTIQEFRSKNRVVKAGLNLVRDLLSDAGMAPRFIGIGVDATPTTLTMASLQQEVFRTPVIRRKLYDSKLVVQAYFSENEPSQSYILTEAGLFANTGWALGVPAVGGIMFARTVHTPVSKVAGATSITYTWEIPIASGV